MAYEQTNIPLAGDILDDLAQAFREIINKVGFILTIRIEIIHIWYFVLNAFADARKSGGSLPQKRKKNSHI